MNEDKKKLLSKVAYMHYIEEKSQDTISKELNIYRTTISRMIKQAKKDGLIEIRIKDFNSDIHQLEMHIKNKFKLESVVIVQTKGKTENEKNKSLSQEAANYLKKIIKNQKVIGVSWGSTLAEAISEIDTHQSKDITFVPIAGGPSHINVSHHVNTLVYELAKKFGGNSIFINATVIQETKGVKNDIMNAKYFQELKEYWKQIDLAIVGIGGTLYAKDSQWRDLLNEQDYEDLKMRSAVGDCCCQFFDKDGERLIGDILDRTISIDLETLREVQNAIGIARSKQKAKAILAVLKKRYINTLITDEETAKYLLFLENDKFLNTITG